MPSEDYLIGVDAGGTKTLAWLCSVGYQSGDDPIGSGQAGCGNPWAVGFEIALKHVREAIESAFRSAKINRQQVSGLCICMAGVGRPEDQARIREWCQAEAFATRVSVCGDAEPVLAAASANLTGIALISGTGSFCWGRNAIGESARAGGWGYLFGDEGSAYRIALESLRAVAQSADGIGPQTQLTERFYSHLSINHPQQLIEAIYGRKLSREQIAMLAQCVFDSSPTDQVAKIVLDQAAEELARMVRCVAGKLMIPEGELLLGLAGGVLVNQEAFRRDVIQRAGVPLGNVVTVLSPVAGAVVLAGRHCRTDRE